MKPIHAISFIFCALGILFIEGMGFIGFGAMMGKPTIFDGNPAGAFAAQICAASILLGLLVGVPYALYSEKKKARIVA